MIVQVTGENTINNNNKHGARTRINFLSMHAATRDPAQYSKSRAAQEESCEHLRGGEGFCLPEPATTSVTSG